MPENGPPGSACVADLGAALAQVAADGS